MRQFSQQGTFESQRDPEIDTAVPHYESQTSIRTKRQEQNKNNYSSMSGIPSISNVAYQGPFRSSKNIKISPTKKDFFVPQLVQSKA